MVLNLVMKEEIAIKEKIKKSGHKLGKEFKKSISTAVVAAFSLLVALSWKDVITTYVNKIQSVTPLKGELISALFITLISVIGILLVTRVFGVNSK
jgi:hypothetical protein